MLSPVLHTYLDDIAKINAVGTRCMKPLGSQDVPSVDEAEDGFGGEVAERIAVTGDGSWKEWFC